MRKILPVFQQGRFFHHVLEHQPAIWRPSLVMYLARLMRSMWRSDAPLAFASEPKNILAGTDCQDKITVSWVGHATFLIQTGNVNILTDPIWGPATWFFKRAMPPLISLECLPPIHLVLISHNHRDHLDASTIVQLKKLNPALEFFVPLGDKLWFDRRGIDRVHEFAWWQKRACADVTCSFLPARHWSGRGLFDRNRSLWGSWMIQSPSTTIYFAGDTAYWRHFACIRHYFSSIDAALMPIAPHHPWEFMRHAHLNAELAVKAFFELGARYFVPMHWGTFKFGIEDIRSSVAQLEKAWRKYQPTHVSFVQKKEQLLLPNLS